MDDQFLRHPRYPVSRSKRTVGTAMTLTERVIAAQQTAEAARYVSRQTQNTRLQRSQEKIALSKQKVSDSIGFLLETRASLHE